MNAVIIQMQIEKAATREKKKMAFLIDGNTGFAVTEGMNLARLACGHNVQIPRARLEATRCFACDSVQPIMSRVCGHCGENHKGCHELYGNSEKTLQCAFQNCKRRAHWSNSGWCKIHGNSRSIARALKIWSQKPPKVLLDEVFAFAVFNAEYCY